jgi:hypothetical protein
VYKNLHIGDAPVLASDEEFVASVNLGNTFPLGDPERLPSLDDETTERLDGMVRVVSRYFAYARDPLSNWHILWDHACLVRCRPIGLDRNAVHAPGTRANITNLVPTASIPWIYLDSVAIRVGNGFDQFVRENDRDTIARAVLYPSDEDESVHPSPIRDT